MLVINHLVNRVSFLHLHLFNLMPSDGVGLETSARVFLNTTANSGVSLCPPSPCYLICCSLCYRFLFQLLVGVIARSLCSVAWFLFHNSVLLVFFFNIASSVWFGAILCSAMYFRFCIRIHFNLACIKHQAGAGSLIRKKHQYFSNTAKFFYENTTILVILTFKTILYYYYSFGSYQFFHITINYQLHLLIV